MSWQRKM